MSHQCVKCNKVYEDGSKELLEGCTECGGKFFFYIKKERLESVQEQIKELTAEEKEQIEQDVLDIVQPEDDAPVILDLEAINVLSPGKFEIDIRHLFQGEPVIYKTEDGKYVIDIASTFQMKKKKT